jgi:HSP20 family protein
MFERVFDMPVSLIEEPWFPQAATVDLEEKEKEFRVHVDLPGVTRDEIAVEVSDHSLLIRARHENPDPEMLDTEPGWMMARRVDLPASVEIDKVTATLHLGQLEVVLPRKEEMQTRKVEVTE